jgi:hypothetical protein
LARVQATLGHDLIEPLVDVVTNVLEPLPYIRPQNLDLALWRITSTRTT